ncbi:AMP-binding protein [Prauserella alba]|uniref:AMP-dependent synthetase/ligase domain-containing protein n=1 Tax=Prauserella alba TaxID=176898 RepID=A0ABP4G866_9PSEU|nr:AMP-binding protein [Prauserella alba]MCP2180807.1 Acyl-CoA synthetase (AMP-forming)/AMP-acid ligase II [Prauserella alba]
MGNNEPWLSRIVDSLDRSRAGLLTEHGRLPWPELVARARRTAAELSELPRGVVLAPDSGPGALVAVLAAGLAEPARSWVIGDPVQWGSAPASPTAAPVSAHPRATPPPDVDGVTYATATSGTTGQPRLLFGRPETLADTVDLYVTGIPEYAEAELFAACTASEFATDLATVLHRIVLPAVVLGRDLMLFRPHQWHAAAAALDGRPAVCLTPPPLALLGSRAASARHNYSGVRFVPEGGGLTTERAERVAAGFAGCSFLTLFGTTETGVLTVTREVRDDDYIGEPLPGKPVWLSDPGDDGERNHGVGTMWTAGPDTRIATTDGLLSRSAEGAVGSGYLARPGADGGFVLAGKADERVDVDGVSIDPGDLLASLRDIRGLVDASVSVDRSGPAGRITIVAVGDVTEGQIRRRLAARTAALVPHEVVCHPAQELSHSQRGKVLR